MLNFALLEWRKNGRFLWGMAGLFLLSLPLAAASSVRARIGALPGVEAGLLFWVALGVPASALFLGAASGAGQRGDLARGAEAVLPLSPARRAAGALLSSAGQTLALAALVGLAASLSPTVRHAFSTGEVWGLGSPFLRPMIVISLFAALYGLLAGFVCAYAFGHGIVGGAAALLLTLPVAAGLCWARGLEILFGPRVPFGFETGLIVLAAAAGPLWALPVFTGWLERRAWPGWRRLARAVLGLGLALMVGFLSLAHQGDRLLHGLFLADSGGFPAVFLSRAAYRADARYASPLAERALAAWPEARKAAAAGVAAQDVRGRIVWITPDGRRRELVPPVAVEQVKDLERLGPWIGARGLAFSEDGSFHVIVERWGLSDPKPRWELWAGKEPPLRRLAWEEGRPPQLVPTAHGLALVDGERGSRRFRAIAADGTLTGWRPYPKVWTEPRAERMPRGAWLPGADGSLRSQVWGRPWDIVAADGTALPPFDPAKAEAAARRRGGDANPPPPVFLRTDGRSVWVLAAGRVMVKARASDGEPELVRALPANPELDRWGTAPYAITSEGLFWQLGRRLLFYGWDGKRRDLGPVVSR